MWKYLLFHALEFDIGHVCVMGQIFARLRALVTSGDAIKVGVGATEAARALGMAPALAKEQLLAAECKG